MTPVGPNHSRPCSESLRGRAAGFQTCEPVARPSSGFSLIELMVVVVLIGIMTAVIIPEMRGSFEDALLRSTSRELVNAFSVASSRAISLNQTHRIRLDRKAGKYVIERKTREGERNHRFAPLKDVAGAEGVLDNRVIIEFHRPGEVSPSAAPDQEAPPPEEDDLKAPVREEGIAFYPDGTADSTEVLLQDRDGFRLALRINPVTARIRIIEMERK